MLASQPRFKGGVLFVDSADKATRFITCCDAFNVPLLFLADVPGFMIGTAVERQGIIRHGAKMIAALAQAQVPRISRDPAQGVRRRALRDERPGVRARLHARAADRADRGDGSGGGDQRRLLQQDPGHRPRTSATRTSQRCRTSTATTSTSSGSRRSSSSTRSCRPQELRAELVRRFAAYRSRRRADVVRGTTRSRRSERAVAGPR